MADEPEPTLERRVRDTLDSVLSPNVREALLSDALAAGGEPCLPSDPERMRQFVLGPLREVLVRALGVQLGDSVACELDRMVDTVERAQSSRRPHSSQRRSATPPRRRNSPPPRTAWPSSVPRGASATLRSAAPTPPAAPPVRSQRAARGNTPPTIRPGRDTKTPQAVPPPRPSIQSASSFDTDPGSSPLARGAAEPDSSRSIDPPTASDAFDTGYKSPRLPHIPTLRAGKPPQSSQVPRPPSSAELPRGTAATLGVRGASPSSSPSRRLPTVLVATQDATLARKLSQWLDPHVAVARVQNLMSLLQDVTAAGEIRVVIVLDCNQPSIRPIALAAVADDLPSNAEVVLWGATPDLEREILMISSRTGEWLACSSETSAKDVAGRCAQLVS